MKYEEYIKKLDNLNEEFEEGLLLGLQEKPPTDLHGKIIKSISKERKRINFFNYRIYAPAMAAILVFAVILNRPELLEKINFIKNAKITQGQIIANNKNTGSNSDLKYKDTEKSAAAKAADEAINNSENPGSEDSIKNTPSDNNIAMQNDSNSTDNKNTTAQPDNASNPKIASQDNTKNTETSPVQENTLPDKNDSEEKSVSIANLLGMLFFKEPEINYEIILDENKSDILNFITENHTEKLSTPNTYKLSSEQSDSLDKLLAKNNIVKDVVNEKDDATSKVVKINFVNYHILINDSAPNILKFIEGQEKCVKISDNTYKIPISNMGEFDKLLNSSGIKKEFINEIEDEYIIIKTLIINYEISIDASHVEVANFLKDTEGCKAIQEGIYKMNRDSLNKFKELLSNSMIEFKILNETNNQEVLIKINNI